MGQDASGFAYDSWFPIETIVPHTSARLGELSLGFDFRDDDRPEVDVDFVGEGAQEDDFPDFEPNLDKDCDEQAYSLRRGNRGRSVSLAASTEGSNGTHTRIRANKQSFGTSALSPLILTLPTN